MAWTPLTLRTNLKARVVAAANANTKYSVEERIMEWISQNWVWVLFSVGMIAMHMFGHGGHGGDENKTKSADKDSASRTSKLGSGHQH